MKRALPYLMILCTVACDTVPGGPAGLPVKTPKTAADVQRSLWAMSVVVQDDTEERILVIGTAFAISESLLATNAHVVDALAELFTLAKVDARAVQFVAIQHETGRRVGFSSIWRHPEYDPDDASILGTPDIAIVGLNELVSDWLPLAAQETTEGISVLDQVSLCGFPGDVELIFETALGGIRPRATCLQGSVTSLRPFNPSDEATLANTFLIQHELSTSPGTSGSPIWNEFGEVLAIHFAGTTDDSASNRFAIRADKIAQLVSQISDGAPAIALAELAQLLDFDADGDGLKKSEELSLGTDPDKFDSDGDSIGDGLEIVLLTDPLVPNEIGLVAEVLCSRSVLITGFYGPDLRLTYAYSNSNGSGAFATGVLVGDLAVLDSNDVVIIIDSQLIPHFGSDVGPVLDFGIITNAFSTASSIGVDISSGISYVFNQFDLNDVNDWQIGHQVYVVRHTTKEGDSYFEMYNRNRCNSALLSSN